MTMRDLLVRGLISGLLAATLAMGFASLVGEPEVDAAIAFEQRAAGDHGTSAMPGMPQAGTPAAAAPEEVSRPLQKSIGLATAIGVMGLAFGGTFALLFAVAYGRVGLGVRGTALLIALAAFGAVYLVPSLKYAPNPPATGNPDTIAVRTQLYFALMLVSLVATIGAAVIARNLGERMSSWNAVLIALGALAVVLVVAFLALPGYDEEPEGFPANVLWRFRLASLGTQFVLWAGIGLIFGALSERLEARAGRSTATAAPVRA